MTDPTPDKPESMNWVDAMFHGTRFPKALDAKRIKPEDEEDTDDATTTATPPTKRGTKRKAHDADPADERFYFTAVDGQRYRRLRKNTLPFWSSGMEYLGSCVRNGIEFNPEQARSADALADVHYKGCYGCVFFDRVIAYTRKGIDDEIEACQEDDPPDPKDVLIQEQARAYLAGCVPVPFDPEEGGMDYARFWGQSMANEYFDVAAARAYDKTARFEALPDDKCYRCFAVRERMVWLERQEVAVKKMIRAFYVPV